jgi:hypothetical protein
MKTEQGKMQPQLLFATHPLDLRELTLEVMPSLAALSVRAHTGLCR